MKRKQAIVVHSGGMDSSLCLALAIREFGKENVLSVSFSYCQRHSSEIIQAQKICSEWGVENVVLSISCLEAISDNALTNHHQRIEVKEGKPNTLVVGRNGLMARLAAIHANHLGAHCIYMGVLGLEGSHAGYRDCSREYMDLKQKILRIDFNDPSFEIRTPLVDMTKKETMILANKLGILEYLLKETITCYQNIPKKGCQLCPACKLRNEGIQQFLVENPNFKMPF